MLTIFFKAFLTFTLPSMDNEVRVLELDPQSDHLRCISSCMVRSLCAKVLS